MARPTTARIRINTARTLTSREESLFGQTHGQVPRGAVQSTRRALLPDVAIECTQSRFRVGRVGAKDVADLLSRRLGTEFVHESADGRLAFFHGGDGDGI